MNNVMKIVPFLSKVIVLINNVHAKIGYNKLVIPVTYKPLIPLKHLNGVKLMIHSHFNLGKC